jgi:hypothetical protein
MWQPYSLIGFLVASLLIILDFYLLRKRKIEGRAFVLWFIVGAVLALFSAVPPLVSLVYLIVGTELVVSTIVIVGFLFFLLVFFYLDYRISELRNKLMKLAMEVSVTKYGEKQSNPRDLKAKKQKSKQK